MNNYKTHDYEGMVAETVSIKSRNGDFINAYLSKPLGDGPFPSIVLAHHLPGWDELYKEFTRKFTHHGYLAITPDLYFREGNGSPDDVASEVRSQGGISDKQALDDLVGAADHLRLLPNSNNKVGIFGTCSGGRHAFLAACTVDTFDAAIECWGGNIVMDETSITEKQPISPVTLSSSLSAPLLGIFGNDDVSPPPDQVDKHEEVLKENNKNFDFHRYDGAGHGFMYYDRPYYRQQQSVDAWDKIFKFTEKNLRK